MKMFAAVLFAPCLVVLPVVNVRGWDSVPWWEVGAAFLFLFVLWLGVKHRG